MRLPLALASGALVLLSACAAPPATLPAAPAPSALPETRETPEALAVVRASLDALLAETASGATARSLAPRLVARGSDGAREWRAPADPDREGPWVRDVLRALAGLPVGAGYRVDEFVVEPESEGVWHVLRVEFDDPGRTEAAFAFLPVGGAFLLGEIET